MKQQIIKRGAVIVFIGACIIFYMLTMFSQDITLFEYKKAFHEIEHPPGTKLIQASASLGAFEKTRTMYKEDFPQGCDYRVGEIRSYSGTRESIETFYSSQKINIEGEERPVGVLFIPVDSEGIIQPEGISRADSIKMGPSSFQILDDLRGDQAFHFLKLEPSLSYYLVSIAGFSLTDFDIRCQF